MSTTVTGRLEQLASATTAAASLTSVTATGTTEERTLGDRFAEEFNVKDFGATGDGSTDDTVAIQAALTAGVGSVVTFPKGTYVISDTLTIYDRTRVIGAGRYNTKLILADSTNDDMLQTDGYSTLTGGDTSPNFTFHLEGLTIDGNRSNNTTGNGFLAYGHSWRIIDFGVQNIAENGIKTEYGGGGIMVGGVEAYGDGIVIDTCGKHGWVWNGPHDAQLNKVIIVDCSLTTDNTYDGFLVETGAGGCRFTNIHPWKRLATTNRMRTAVRSNGGHYNQSTFEGGHVAIWATGSLDVDQSSIFGARSDATIVLEASNCNFNQCVVTNNADIETLNAVRVGVAEGSQGLNTRFKDCTFSSYDAPIFNLDHASYTDNLDVDCVAYACTAPYVEGLLGNNDKVRLKGDGSPTTDFRHEPLLLTNYGSGGSTIDDAQDMTAPISRVTATGTYRLGNAPNAGVSHEIIARATFTLYPPTGTQFINQSGDSISNNQAVTIRRGSRVLAVGASSTQTVLNEVRGVPIGSISSTPNFTGQQALVGGVWYIAVGESSTADWIRTTEVLATSVGSTPSYIGQFAVVAGVGYMATGVSSSADWKQITN